MSITKGGPGFPVLADAVYKYFVTGKTTNLHIPSDSIPSILKYFAQQVYTYSVNYTY